MSGRTPSQPLGRSLGPSGHVDDFARRNLPPSDQWPDLLLDRPEFQYPEYLNAAVELTDRIVEKGWGDRIALIGNGRQRTYKELADWSNRLAHALVENYGVKPGNRVLIRSGNNPALVAAWLAATKAGAVVVNTMPMLRAGELGKIVDKAEIALALTDSRIADELVACAKTSRFLKQVVNFDGTSNHDAELDRVALNKPVKFDAVKTGRDDVALLGFTSGTTGEPKATMHFHRDLLIVADGYAREVLNVTEDDVFVGSPPLAFTFGLGGLAIFPLRFGATATLLENASPPEMVKIIETYKATICFTSPTAYRAMMAAMDKGADLSSLRLAVSAGETLPAPVFENWTRKTGKTILDGIGSTELLHIFITNRVGDAVSLRQYSQDILEHSREAMCDRDDGVIRSQFGILNATLLHGREHHGRVGEELVPVALDKGDSGRAEAHNQVERACGMQGTKILDEWSVRVFIAGTGTHERMLCDLQQPW